MNISLVQLIAALRETWLVLHHHSHLWQTHEGLVEELEGFRSRLAEAAARILDKTESTSGPGLSLWTAKEELIRLTLDIAAPCRIWGMRHRDDLMVQAMEGEALSLLRFGTFLPSHCETITRLARFSLDDGAGRYGLSREMIEKLDAAGRHLRELQQAAPGVTDSVSTLLTEVHFLTDCLLPLLRPWLRENPSFAAACAPLQRKLAWSPGVGGDGEVAPEAWIWEAEALGDAVRSDRAAGVSRTAMQAKAELNS